MRQLSEIAADFLAHRSVERSELVALLRSEAVLPQYTTDTEFNRLSVLLGAGGTTAKGILTSITSLPQR